MTDHADHTARLVEMLEEEAATGELGWWWISYVDPDRPEGQRFLGVTIVQALGFASALRKVHELGINPGGEVAACGTTAPAPQYTDRLLSMSEATALAGHKVN